MILVLIALSPKLALAANQLPGGLNLGSTSFFDGFGPTSGGFTYQAYLAFATSSTIYDAAGNEVGVFRDPKISTGVFVNQVTYFLPETLFGDTVRPGINFILPLVLFDTSFGAPGPALTDNGLGFGDLTFGPTFQFKPVMADEHPVFSHRLGLDLIVPTGSYDPAKNLNQSSNYVSFNPNWAATLVLPPGIDLSIRLHYLFNFRNLRPTNTPFALGPLVESARAGQAVWLNFAASFPLESLHIGINGYYLKQLTADTYRLADGTRTDAEMVGEGKAQVLGIGPGAMWDAGRGNLLFANLYFEPLVNARAGSTVVNARWLHTF